MKFVNRLRAFLFKLNFDFDRPDIDIYNFHPQLPAIFAMQGIFFHNKDSLIRLIWPLAAIGLSTIGGGLEVMMTVHFFFEKDYSVATECFCYIVIVGCMFIIYIGILLNKDNIYSIIESMNCDFICIRNMEAKYRKLFLKSQLQIWQFFWVWSVFDSVVGIAFTMVPIVGLCYQTLFSTQDEHTSRPLPFIMWLPHDDPYRTPIYETFFVMHTFIITYSVQTSITYVSTMFHVLLHYNNIMDIIILQFRVLFDDLEESVALLSRYDQRRVETQLILNRRIGNIVKMHISVFQAVKTISSVHGPVLMYFMAFSPVALCLMAFQIAEKLENGSIDFLFVLLGTSTILQLWIPCYLGTKIRNKAFAVGDACWDCGWHLTSLGLLVRSDIITIILRAQQPVTIKFIGLPSVELETFSAIMSKSYSFFNMLRQYGN